MPAAELLTCPSPRRARARQRALAPVLLTLLALVGSVVWAAPADAASTTWKQAIATANGTQSTGRVTWQTSPLSVQLTVTTGTLAPGKCVTVFFDWATPTHYDARAIRDCRSHDTLTHTFVEPTPSTLSGQANKYGICYGLKDTHGTCIGQGSIYLDWTPWPDTTRPDPCHLSWIVRNANGTVTSFIDTHPRSATLRPGGTC